MKNLVTKSIMLATAAAAFGITMNAQAANFPERDHMDKQSRARGVGLSSVSLLRRVEGPGAQQRAMAILKKLQRSTSLVHARGRHQEHVDLDSKRVTLHGDDGWSLSVWEDGTKVRYRNHKAASDGVESSVPVENRLTSEYLGRLGEEFIRDSLADWVRLGPDDELVPSFTEYEINGLADGDTGVVLEELVSGNTVVFSRRVNGIDIVGPGSKIAVMFTNDGSAIGFDFDWPRYVPSGKVQSVLTLSEIVERASALGRTPAHPDTVNLERFECGYFDTGARTKKARQALQSACSASYTGRVLVDEAAYRANPEDGWAMVADINMIPAGAEVEADENWPESLAIATGLELPGVSGVTKALARADWGPPPAPPAADESAPSEDEGR